LHLPIKRRVIKTIVAPMPSVRASFLVLKPKQKPVSPFN
jgi:hypothetical protein